MPILLASEQYTEEWFEKRKGKVSASIVGSALSLPDAFSTREAQIRSIVRGVHGILRNENRGGPHMAYGLEYERHARDEFGFEHDCKVIQHGMYAHDQYEWLIASPDGQIEGKPIGIEIKCPYHPKFTDPETPAWEMRELSMDKIERTRIEKKPSYYAQMQVQMQVMGWDSCYYVVWTPYDMHVDLIQRDKLWWADNFPKLRRFYEEIQEVLGDQSQYAPMLEDETVDLSNDLAWCTNASKLRDIQQKIKQLKEAEQAYKDRLIEIAQQHNKTCKGGGFSVIRKSGQSRVDWKSVVEEVAPTTDLSKYTTVGDATWAVTPVKMKEAS